MNRVGNMPMTVAVTNELNAESKQLRKLGYHVVEYGKYKHPVDAIVYSGEGLLSLGVTNSASGGAEGVFMLNAQNKKIHEIDNALKNRVYTPLF